MTKTDILDSYVEQEKVVAERYRWWGVYLIREQRRLQGIADVVSGTVPVPEPPLDEEDTRPHPPVDMEAKLQGRAALLAEQKGEEY